MGYSYITLSDSTHSSVHVVTWDIVTLHLATVYIVTVHIVTWDIVTVHLATV